MKKRKSESGIILRVCIPLGNIYLFILFYPAVTLGENLKGKQCKSLNLAFENIGVKKAGSRKGTWNFAILDQFYLSEKKVFYLHLKQKKNLNSLNIGIKDVHYS